MLTASGAASSQLAGATSMIATDISGATPLPSQTRPEGAIEADVKPGTVHLSVPFSTHWKLTLDGNKIEARPAFGLTNAYDVASPGHIRLGFESSRVHSLAVLLQFAVWCVVAFFALVRPRRRSRRQSSVSSELDAPVMSFVSEDSL
jgi:hypothetical protein